MTDNLPDLRDIHLPTAEISAWPPAKGWWLLLLGLILLVLIAFLWRYLRQKSAKIYALHLLKKTAAQDDLAAVAQMSEILRRICVQRFTTAVALSGTDWIAFLNDKSTYQISDNEARLLLNAPFMPENTAVKPEEVQHLRQFCLAWVGANL